MPKLSAIPRYSKKAVSVYKDEGLLGVMIVSLQKIQKKYRKKSTRKQKFLFLAKQEDMLKANWTKNPYIPPVTAKKPPYTINWVMSPPANGGGHQNIFRFIQYLEGAGHTCRVYLYSTSDFPTIAEVTSRLSKTYPNLKATIQWLTGKGMEPADAVFATGWETAYPVFNDSGDAQKFYFVQDFEPYFYAVGSEYVLAENTYRFNFHGITAGGWLAAKLSKEYGMKCDSYEFGADPALYTYTNSGKRKEIFFYARPVTTRRGFELGIMALQRFHEQMPDYTITLAGWDVSDYAIPFPYKNLKTLTLGELSEVYNECAAGLVISLTNMSLMPLELLACGVIPVVNDGLNNRQVSENPYIKYVDASPDALAEALVSVVTREDLPKYALEASRSVGDLSWDKSGKKFVRILEERLHG